ncbi:MAG: lysophospholipid acyltransferase family protein [Steroidobacteraceae bacterium]
MSPPADLDPETERLGFQTGSNRRLTFARQWLYHFLMALGRLTIDLLWGTSRLTVIGEQTMSDAVTKHGSVIPVCWHQHLLMCARYLVAGRIKQLKPGFLVSPSVDGEAPSMLAETYGAQVIRGSSTYTGTRAIRHLCKALARDHLSPLITPDGPRGPRFEFKAGALLVAQLSGVPIVPMAYAARPARVLRTWDKFVLIPPFARIVVALGTPIHVPRDLNEAQREALRVEIRKRMLETYQLAEQALRS